MASASTFVCVARRRLLPILPDGLCHAIPLSHHHSRADSVRAVSTRTAPSRSQSISRSSLSPVSSTPSFMLTGSSSDKLRNSWLAHILIAVLAYATVIWLDQYLSPQGIEFTAWWKGGGGLRFMSLARYVGSVCQLSNRCLLGLSLAMAATALAAIPAVDHAPGPSAHRGPSRWPGGSRVSRRRACGHSYLSAFCLGVGLAGAIANRVFHDGQKLVAFRHLPVILIAAVLSHLCRAVFPVHRHADANAAPWHV